MKIGIGYDIHRLDKSRKLILGGVTIPFAKGLLGHSDADVLVHSVCDALLGAAGEGDIGTQFPDSDPAYKDVSSLHLLTVTDKILHHKGFSVVNIDATIMAEAPKLSAYHDSMRKNIAATLDIDISCVGVKATTTEGLGMIGRGEGIAAMSVALITEAI
jgi:2-C-methyl-D-erythritol 2,4-cyclodiphosphate synthase